MVTLTVNSTPMIIACQTYHISHTRVSSPPLFTVRSTIQQPKTICPECTYLILIFCLLRLFYLSFLVLLQQKNKEKKRKKITRFGYCNPIAKQRMVNGEILRCPSKRRYNQFSCIGGLATIAAQHPVYTRNDTANGYKSDRRDGDEKRFYCIKCRTQTEHSSQTKTLSWRRSVYAEEAVDEWLGLGLWCVDVESEQRIPCVRTVCNAIRIYFQHSIG